MDPTLRSVLAEALGCPVANVRPLAGGDINQAFAVTLGDGRCVFVKSNPKAPDGMFTAEADGLAWLREANAVRIPAAIAVRDAAPAFLALEYIEPAARVAGFDDLLGRALAALHSCPAPTFGHHRNNFIGRLPQDNRPCDTWPDFYRDRRIEPQVRMAASRGLVDSTLRRRFDGLYERLAVLCGPPEPPARLHGDLWGGNLHTDGAGRPALIDPAVYGGHREVDLAMMKLFGGFSERSFAAYAEVSPLAPDWNERVPLHQLYPLLVHVNLFGAGYVSSVRRALDAIE